MSSESGLLCLVDDCMNDVVDMQLCAAHIDRWFLQVGLEGSVFVARYPEIVGRTKRRGASAWLTWEEVLLYWRTIRENSGAEYEIAQRIEDLPCCVCGRPGIDCCTISIPHVCTVCRVKAALKGKAS